MLAVVASGGAGLSIEELKADGSTGEPTAFPSMVFEVAAVHPPGPAIAFASGGDARELVIRADRADGRGAGELVVANVVNLQCAGRAAAQQEIACDGHAAEVADARELVIRAELFAFELRRRRYAARIGKRL